MTKKRKRASRSLREIVNADPDNRRPVEIAEAAKISRSYLYGLMTGDKVNPKPWTIRNLAEALGITEGTMKRALAETAKSA